MNQDSQDDYISQWKVILTLIPISTHYPHVDNYYSRTKANIYKNMEYFFWTIETWTNNKRTYLWRKSPGSGGSLLDDNEHISILISFKVEIHRKYHQEVIHI